MMEQPRRVAVVREHGAEEEHRAEEEHVAKGKADHWRREGNVHESKCRAFFSSLFCQFMKAIFWSKCVLRGSR